MRMKSVTISFSIFVIFVLLLTTVSAGRKFRSRHRKRGVLNHIRYPGSPFKAPISYALRPGGATVVSYSATSPLANFRKIVLPTPTLVVGQRPVHFDEGYVHRPMFIQRPVHPVLGTHVPASTPAVIADGQHQHIVNPVHPVYLGPRPVVENEPVHLYPINVPSTSGFILRPSYPVAQDTRPVQINPGHLYPVNDSPTPGVVVENRPSYTPGHLFPASQHEDSVRPVQGPILNVPSALLPAHYYPANGFGIGPIAQMPATGHVYPGNDEAGPAVSAVPVYPSNYPGNHYPDNSASPPTTQDDASDASASSHPTQHHESQQPDNIYYTPGNTGVYVTPSVGGQGSTSQQSPWQPMMTHHSSQDSSRSAGSDGYHYHQQHEMASAPSVGLLPPYGSQHGERQNQQYHRYEYTDY